DRPRRRRGLEDRADFEKGRNADPVVAGPGPGRRAVIMGTEQELLAWTGAGDRRDHIAYPRAADHTRLREAAAILGFLDARLQADRVKFGNKPAADCVVGGTVDRVRPLVAENALQPRERARCVEFSGCDARVQRRWCDQLALEREPGEQQRDDQQRPPGIAIEPHAVPPSWTRECHRCALVDNVRPRAHLAASARVSRRLRKWVTGSPSSVRRAMSDARS